MTWDFAESIHLASPAATSQELPGFCFAKCRVDVFNQRHRRGGDSGQYYREAFQTGRWVLITFDNVGTRIYPYGWRWFHVPSSTVTGPVPGLRSLGGRLVATPHRHAGSGCSRQFFPTGWRSPWLDLASEAHTHTHTSPAWSRSTAKRSKDIRRRRHQAIGLETFLRKR